ncbi:MAG: hypothetical protein LAT58_07630, partial [Opitutales bacterium]|nr:hypothetical protein [Opitutales bacterium]
ADRHLGLRQPVAAFSSRSQLRRFHRIGSAAGYLTESGSKLPQSKDGCAVEGSAILLPIGSHYSIAAFRFIEPTNGAGQFWHSHPACNVVEDK